MAVTSWIRTPPRCGGAPDNFSGLVRGGACPRGHARRTKRRSSSRGRRAPAKARSHDPAAGRQEPSTANVKRTVLDAEKEQRTPEETRHVASDHLRGLPEPPSSVPIPAALVRLRGLRAGWFGGGGLDPPFAARDRVRSTSARPERIRSAGGRVRETRGGSGYLAPSIRDSIGWSRWDL
jgi:hypothetical protein